MRPAFSIINCTRMLRPTITRCKLPVPFASTRMYAQRPQWLEFFFQESHPPPKLFAWDPSNLGLRGGRVPGVADDLDRRIFVLGVGNLGRLFASCLAQAPESPPVTLVVHRKELLAQWDTSQGIEILRSDVLEKNKNFDIEWWTDSPPDHGVVREVSGGMKLRNLLVTTKATAALPQVDRLRGYLDRNSTVMFAQNGMSKLWPPHGHAYTSHRYSADNVPNFLACVTTHGVTSQGPFRSLHASQADVAIGTVLLNQSSSEAADYLVRQILEAPHLDGKTVSRAELWILQLEKLVVNSVINPLTAILGCKNGALFTGSDGVLAGVIDQLVGEASQVLQLLVSHESSADIIRDIPASRYPESRLDLSPHGLCDRFSQPRLKDMVYRVGDKVRENTSSMLQDVRAGRSTEIRDFNGWLVEIAAFLDPSLGLTGHGALVELVEAGKTLRVDQLGSHFDKSGAPS
ncbi:ketopantoate reductase PanE/ApbA C terminal-domain-containing protein [Dactylonectria estremocensis]|uniref:Ketopantoate reductase PanE/ApbA C terminal-domain-containing protein n=1 Tax=Dactylonectria estremocensis TaxID=1079267 RepID=A0A9P9J353_9HYPO|nr:ketopantoate reductase PanE/ApbA C terminal-domain-containing protein [Dactylonectria estremocensis]